MRRPGTSVVVRTLGVTLALAACLALPTAAAATVTGGCQATGTSTSGGAIDLTTATVWHLRSTDTVTVTGTSPAPQNHGSASASAVGLAIPLANGGSERGETSFTSDAIDVGLLARLGRVFVISGSSQSAFHGCQGRIEIVIDDVNPVATVLGVAGIGGIAVGLAWLLWALGRPESGWRRLLGLLGLALAGGGAGTLLQQVSTPGQAGPATPGWALSVAGPAQVSVDPVVLVGSAALALLLVIVMPFPSTLFNSTLEANLPEIRAATRRLPIVGRWLAPGREARDSETSPVTPSRVGWRHPVAVGPVVLVAALLYGFLDPSFGPDAPSAILFVSLVASMVTVTWISSLPRRVLQHRLTGDAGHAWAVPGTLLIAAGCVVLSRLASFEPGYLYGLVVGYSFATEIPEREEGRGSHAGAWWMLGIAAVAWFALGAVRTPGIEPSIPAAVLASIFAGLTVAGIEGIVFGMLPLRFLAGEHVFRWSRPRWALLYGLGAFAFAWIILDPANGFLSARTGPSFATAVALFVAFGIGSVLFWAYFGGRHRPVAAPEHPV